MPTPPKRPPAPPRAVLYAFDLLFLDGEGLRAKPLEDRRVALGGILPAGGAVVMSEEFAGAAARSRI